MSLAIDMIRGWSWWSVTYDDNVRFNGILIPNFVYEQSNTSFPMPKPDVLYEI